MTVMFTNYNQDSTHTTDTHLNKTRTKQQSMTFKEYA